MTYSLQHAQLHPHRITGRPAEHEVTLVLGCLALLLWVLAMCSYSARRRLVHLGHGPGRTQLGGGAWAPGWPTAATSCLVFHVVECWWPSPACWRRWCAGCAAATARHTAAVRSRPDPRAPATFARHAPLLVLGGAGAAAGSQHGAGVVAPVPFESLLPGHAGAWWSYLLGPAAMRWLGFTGSGLLGIICLVMAVALVFGFPGVWRNAWARAWKPQPAVHRTLLERCKTTPPDRAPRRRATLLRERSDDANPAPRDAPAAARRPADP